MNKQGMSSVSPAYDLTFSSGPAGEHCTMIMGEGKNPKLSHLVSLAEIRGIKKQKALQIIDEVEGAVSNNDPKSPQSHCYKPLKTQNLFNIRTIGVDILITCIHSIDRS